MFLTKNMNAKKNPQNYINRDISWLAFNERVLQEAENKEVPLGMRLKFLGIYSNNQDEFFKVRVATLRRLAKVKKTPLQFNAQKILDHIYKIVGKLQQRFEAAYKDIISLLSSYNVFIINEKELTAEQGEYIKNYFYAKIRPLLVPLMFKNNMPQTAPLLLKDGSVYLATLLTKSENAQELYYTLIELPNADKISRFVVVPAPANTSNTYIMLLDDVIRYCLNGIFEPINLQSSAAYTIKITKDAELDVENDLSKSLLERLYQSVKKRKLGEPVRFIHDEEMPPEWVNFFSRKLKIAPKNIIKGGRYHNFKDFMNFPALDIPEFNLISPPPVQHYALNPLKSVIQTLKKQDIILNFPYHSFVHVIDFLREAAIDPQVQSIKITLYRVAKKSNIINALLNAQQNGKQVTVVLELQARFDEEANIEWAKQLQEVGIKVVHGQQGTKIHAKLCLVQRKEGGNKIGRYVFISTGNFNEDTAKVYTDIGFFTANPEICKEVAQVFEGSENSQKSLKKFKQLLVAPVSLKSSLLQYIDKEIKYAKAGEEAFLIFKLNALTDEQVIQKLYAAAQAGVKVYLIVRGACSLVPTLQKLNNNIELISIVDKYLEHSRVYYFNNKNNPICYISSADAMQRNLHNRIEIACPITNKKLKNEIKQVLDFQLADTVKARFINQKKGNKYKLPSHNLPPLRSQEATYNYFLKKINAHDQ